MDIFLRIISSKWFYLIFFILGILVFYPIIVADKLVDIDFELVIKPLVDVHSIQDYWNAFLGPRLLDIQPVRDLSLIIDLVSSQLINHQVFGLFNLLFWMASCLVVEKILGRYQKGFQNRILVLILLVHPILAWSLYWPTARKHFLTVFFILLATWKALEYIDGVKKNGFWIFLFYFLAQFSQPISILWPIGFACLLGKKIKERDSLVLLGILGLTASLVFVLNYYYYKLLFPGYTGGAVRYITFSLPSALLSFSRSLTQILFPVSFAADYSKTSFLGFVGLPLFFSFIYLMWFKVRDFRLFIFLFLMLHPLSLVIARAPNVFVSETYLLIPWSFFIILVGFYFAPKVPEKFLSVAGFFLVMMLGIKSFIEAGYSSSPSKFSQISYEREPTCKNLMSHSNNLLRQPNFAQFMEVAGLALNRECVMLGNISTAFMNQTYAFRIALDDEIKSVDKLKTLKDLKLRTPAVLYLYSVFRVIAGEKIVGGDAIKLKNIQDLTLLPALRHIHAKYCNESECEKLKL